MNKKQKAYIILLFTTAFWGGNFVFGKVVVATIPPFIMSFTRWTIALSLLIPLLYKIGWPEYKQIRGYLKYIFIMAITGVFGFNTLVYFSVKYTTSVNAALVNSLSPVAIVILSSIFLTEKLSFKQFIGIFISFTGVLVVISQGNFQTFQELHFNIGDLLMMIAVLLWAIYSIFMKKLTVHLKSITITTISAIFGWLLLAPFALWEIFHTSSIKFSGTSVAGLIYIGVFASVLAFLGWNEGVIHLGPGKSSVFLNLIPVFAAIFSFIFLQEKLLMHQIIGGIVVISGVLITNISSLKKSTTTTLAK